MHASQQTRKQHRTLALVSVVFALLVAACNLNTPIEPDGEVAVVGGPPAVSLAAPLANATYLEGVAVNVQALVTNAGEDVDRVDIAVNGTVIATVASPNAAGASAFSVTQTWLATGVGQHTVSVTAIRSTGEASEPTSITINVQAADDNSAEAASEDAGIVEEPTPQPAIDAPGPTIVPTESSGEEAPPEPAAEEQAAPPEPEPTEPEEEPEPEEPEPEQSSTPTARFNVGVNVRSGPSTLFNPPIGSFAANDETEILAVNPAGDWYKVRYFNGEGWVFGQLLTASGNTGSLPVESGPPVPTLTPVIPTATPVPPSSVNLVITSVEFSDEPDEGVTFTIRVTIRNDGTTRSNSGGVVRGRFTADRDDTLTGQTEGTFPELDPGQSFTTELRMTIDTYVDEKHDGVFTVDANNQVNETNENDNTFERDIENL